MEFDKLEAMIKDIRKRPILIIVLFVCIIVWVISTFLGGAIGEAGKHIVGRMFNDNAPARNTPSAKDNGIPTDNGSKKALMQPYGKKETHLGKITENKVKKKSYTKKDITDSIMSDKYDGKDNIIQNDVFRPSKPHPKDY